MIGTKDRVFAVLPSVTLEDLVSADHVSRHLKRTLDLSFVWDLVRDRYALSGRPSIDPVVFCKLQLVLFFEGIRSERQLLALAADRLSVRWKLGYDLDEALPNASGFSRMRRCLGLDVFRRFFERIIDLCQDAGLVWGKELVADTTRVPGNAEVPRPRTLPCPHTRRMGRTTYFSDDFGQGPGALR